uniref:Uncharacterized protein n=1 Tax=Nothobranchius furzeri TaxID=105023 RepID=A0A8C6PPJ2_NOTFU
QSLLDRIKMCGRELIRLAVSTCGNSRLRRNLQEKYLIFAVRRDAA